MSGIPVVAKENDGRVRHLVRAAIARNAAISARLEERQPLQRRMWHRQLFVHLQAIFGISTTQQLPIRSRYVSRAT